MCLDRFLCSSDELSSRLCALFGYFAAGGALLSQSLCCLVYHFLLSTFTAEAKLLTTDGQNYCQRAVKKTTFLSIFQGLVLLSASPLQPFSGFHLVSALLLRKRKDLLTTVPCVLGAPAVSWHDAAAVLSIQTVIAVADASFSAL